MRVWIPGPSQSSAPTIALRSDTRLKAPREWPNCYGEVNKYWYGPSWPSPDLVDTGSSGLALCLFGGDIPEGGM